MALRLVVDREREIEAFKTEEYWKITALLAPADSVSPAPRPLTLVPAKTKGVVAEGTTEEKTAAAEVPPGSFMAELAEWAGKKFESANRETTEVMAQVLDTASYAVSKIEQKDRSEKAPPPFTTSTLQQQANIRMRFTGDRTMRAAQKLYEGVELSGEGSVALITYMRTDSTRVSNDALQAVRATSAPVRRGLSAGEGELFRLGQGAQERRGGSADRFNLHAGARERLLSQSAAHRHDLVRLYTLIYNRFVASQMTPAVFAITNVEVTATPRAGANGSLQNARQGSEIRRLSQGSGAPASRRTPRCRR